MDIQRSFQEAVNALPAYLRERVDSGKSWRTCGGAWTLCDSDGNEVKAPPIQKALEGQKQTFLRIKRLDTPSAGRWLSGIATTPGLDRHGDVVVPTGAKYSLPLPVLWQHKHDAPIGRVSHASISREGIHVKIKLAEGVAAADECWRLLEQGVPLSLSIGFIADKAEPTATGLRFTAWTWTELSVVSVPANAEARLNVGKGLVVEAGAQEPEPGGNMEWVMRFLRERGVDPFSAATRAELLSRAAEIHALEKRINQLEGVKNGTR